MRRQGWKEQRRWKGPREIGSSPQPSCGKTQTTPRRSSSQRLVYCLQQTVSKAEPLMRVLNNLAAFLCALRTTQLSQSVNAGCCAENLALSCRFPQTSEHVVFNRREKNSGSVCKAENLFCEIIQWKHHDPHWHVKLFRMCCHTLSSLSVPDLWIFVTAHVWHQQPKNQTLCFQIRSDKSQKATVEYYLRGPGADKPPFNLFVVNHGNGYVQITDVLDREKCQEYNVSRCDQ